MGESTTHQPYLHESVMVVRAPSLVASGQDGQLAGGSDGFYHADVRAASVLLVTVDGRRPVPIHSQLQAADRAVFRAVLPGLGEHSPDPAVVLTRDRQVRGGTLIERLQLTDHGRGPVECRVRIEVAGDLASMSAVKSGRAGAVVPAHADGDGLSWASDDAQVSATFTPAPGQLTPAGADYLVRLDAGESWECELRCTARARVPGPFASPTGASWGQVGLEARDDRLRRWLDCSLSDVDALRLQEGSDVFAAAGAPWFLTLFGRDSLWTARMLLPLGTDLAAGTLRVLARRQGRIVNRENSEEPGKILHEIRSEDAAADLFLPPLYYGTIDATPLWIVLLHDAWCWGLPEPEIRELLPALEGALAWMRDHGDSDGDGLLEYVDHTGRGLSNQGWKDSMDSVQWPDGSLATPPIALCEVQAYAYEAAMCGARLLEHFDRPGAREWRNWAGALQRRFRATFWVEDSSGEYPAIALDSQKRPVESVTSNLGHLLGTGLLDPRETEIVARRLAETDLSGGFGLRTFSARAGRFNPLGYHTGSVWPHDTAIALSGLARAGFGSVAAQFVPKLVRAAEGFGYRLPELFSGTADLGWNTPDPYPAACRPQAWSAAACVAVLQSLLGVRVDVPAGRVQIRPSVPAGLLPLRWHGLRIAGDELSISVGADGSVQVAAPASLAVAT